MGLIIRKNIIIQCDKCGAKHSIDKDSLDISVSSDERQMGFETNYEFVGETICNNCDNICNYKIIGYEYPVYALNYVEKTSTGCTFVEEPDVVVNHDKNE